MRLFNSSAEIFPARTAASRRIPWAVVLAVGLGLAVTVVSTKFLIRFAGERQVTAQIPVPAREIRAYSEIGPEDIVVKSIPVSGVQPDVARTTAEVVGKVAAVPLYPGEQIRKERLIAKTEFDPGQQIVTVNVNLVRAGAGTIRPGDLVDVYWLQGETVPGALLASDARVLDIRDGQGKRIGEPVPGNDLAAQVAASKSQAGIPAVAVLAVKPSEVPQVVRGAWKTSENVVLVKKFREGGASVAAPSQPLPQPAGDAAPAQ